MFARETGFSGPQILDFFSQYSADTESYPWGGGAPSRWQIFEDCLARFDSEQQKRIISDLLDYDGPMKYGPATSEDVEKIREWLGEGSTPVAWPAPTTEKLNWVSVNQSWKKASEKITTDPAGAITAARSLLEGVCKHILDERKVSYSKDGDLQKLYRATTQALRLSPGEQGEDIFRQVLGGCATVVTGMAGMRNLFSDAHGRGVKDVEAATRHARLAVNAAGTIATFMIESHLAQSE
jgi:hypothetical protein